MTPSFWVKIPRSLVRKGIFFINLASHTLTGAQMMIQQEEWKFDHSNVIYCSFSELWPFSGKELRYLRWGLKLHVKTNFSKFGRVSCRFFLTSPFIFFFSTTLIPFSFYPIRWLILLLFIVKTVLNMNFLFFGLFRLIWMFNQWTFSWSLT